MSLEQFFDGAPETSECNEYNLLVPYYIMMAYRYYEKDDPIVSDHLFDLTAKKLLSNWEKISHFHKDYLNTDMLRAGTYIGEYPGRAVDACYSVSSGVFEKRLRKILNITKS